MPATIRDVAREAGVSITTAHRALTDKNELRAETRERVLVVADQLGYVPSGIARALVSGKTKTIGMAITDNASPVYAGIVKGVEEVANAAGFGLLLCNSADTPAQALRCLATLQEKNVDGVLLTPVQVDRREIAHLKQSSTPFVLLLRHFPDVETDYVVIDNEFAGRLATDHLLDLGHRRIGHVAGPSHVSSAQGRFAGYRQALAERGVRFDQELVRHGSFTVAGGHEAARALLQMTDRPTAIFAANDLQAVGVMKAAGELDVRIPDDLALVGGDDIELAAFLQVPLTTFHQPAHEIGVRAAELLLRRLRGEAVENHQIVLKPTLIVRRSSGWPR